MYAERLPPHDLNAEESVIGSILIDGDSLTAVTSFLNSSDFYGERNRHCFDACIALFERGEAINQVTVAHELSLADHLESIGGSGYLGHLVMVVPTSVHIENYAKIVQRMAIMRQLIEVGGRIAGIGFDGGPDSDVALSRAEELLFTVRTGRGAGDFTHIRDVLDTYLEESTAMHGPGSDHLAPVTTGFKSMDDLLGAGMQRSDMIVLAARPSVGKSTLAFNIARNAAGQGNSVGIFSLEMSRDQIAMRMLASEADVDSYRMRLGLLSTNEETRLLDAAGMLSDMPIYIDDTPIQNIVEMRGKARRLKAERGLDFLIIDYLQLIGGTGRVDNRVQEMGEISRSIKGMARDLEIPIMACSQLSRAIEQRPNHRPLLSDLRESGSIEQDADIVAFIHREDAFITREDWEKREPTKAYPENIAEIIFAKHRNGPVGSVPLYFRSDVVRFESLESSPTMEYA
ncbi:MAG: replicative DNA helicase [Chloroflexi bacterium]|nr:replicative DNA helicase [Chloroflexota bacterium]